MASQEDTNFYHPQGSEDSASTAPTRSKKSSSISWSASEYIEHQRGPGWYLGLVIATLLLALGTYFLTKDFFAAGLMIVLGIILGVFAGHKPRQITYELSDSGLRVGEKLHSYGSFKCFYVKQEGELASINLRSIKRFVVDIGFYFDAKDYKRIINLLGDHLPYEEFTHDTVNWLDRLIARLKL